MPKKSRGRSVLLRITIVLALILVVCTFSSRTISNSLLPEVTVSGVSQGTLNTNLHLNGTVKYSKTVTLRAPVSAPVLEVYVAPGDTVAEGDKVAKLDLREYRLAYDRMQLSLDQLREDRNGYGLTSAQKDLLDRQIELMETELSLYAEHYIADDFVRAVQNGTVRDVMACVGQSIAAEDAIAELIPSDAVFQITLYLPQELAQPYQSGDRATVRYQDVTSGSLEQLTAVSEIAKKTFDLDSGLYAVTVPADIPALHEGQEVSVQLVKTSEYYDNLVPRAAVQYDASTNMPFVYTILERNGLFGTETLIQRYEISILGENAIYAAVDNFNHADRVVVSTTQSIRVGQKVRVVGS